MTPGVRHILKLMAENHDSEDGELVCEGIFCYLGNKRVHRRTVNSLLGLCAIRSTSEPGGLERFVINGTGTALLEYPLLEPELYEALRARRSFQIIKGKIVYLK